MQSLIYSLCHSLTHQLTLQLSQSLTHFLYFINLQAFTLINFYLVSDIENCYQQEDGTCIPFEEMPEEVQSDEFT